MAEDWVRPGALCGAACFRRAVVMPVHRSRPDGSFTLDGLVSGRVDLVCRCITSSLFISYGTRRNVLFKATLIAPKPPPPGRAPPPVTVSIDGATVRSLSPDERGVAALLYRRLTGRSASQRWRRRSLLQPKPEVPPPR